MLLPLMAIKQLAVLTLRESTCKSFTSILVLPNTARMLTLYSRSAKINLKIVLQFVL